LGFLSIRIRWDLTEQIKKLSKTYEFNELSNKFDSLKLITINKDPKPTQSEIELLKPYADLTVQSKTLDNWYCLLRNCQGRLDCIIDCGYALRDDDCDHAYEYCLNFVNNEFVVIEYKKIYSCKLDNIPENWWDNYWFKSDIIFLPFGVSKNKGNMFSFRL